MDFSLTTHSLITKTSPVLFLFKSTSMGLFIFAKLYIDEPPQETQQSLVAAPPGFDTPGGDGVQMFSSLSMEDDVIKEEPTEETVQTDMPMIVTPADETADTVSTSSVGAPELITTADDLQFNIKAMIDFIVRRIHD